MILGMNLLSRMNLYIRHPCDIVSNDKDIEEKLYFPDADPYFSCRQLHFKKTYKLAAGKIHRLKKIISRYMRRCKVKGKRPTRRRIQQLIRTRKIEQLIQEFQKDRSKFHQQQADLHPVMIKTSRNQDGSQSHKNNESYEEIFPLNIQIGLSAEEPPSVREQLPIRNRIRMEWTLKTPKRVTIPAASESTNWLTLPPKMTEVFKGEQAILEPYNQEESLMKIGAELFIVGDRIPVRMINVADQPVHLHKNYAVGKIVILPQGTVIQTVKNITPEGISMLKQSRCMQTEETPDISDDEAQHQMEEILQAHVWTREINISSKLSMQEKLQILKLIVRFQQAFSTSKFDLGLTKEVEFQIPTTNTTPIAVPPYRLPYQKKQILKDLLPSMIEAGIIEPSTSSYNLPVVMVKKQNGEYRLCIDMRKINEVTIPTNLPIPNISECLDILKDKNFFSSLDLNAAYHQIPIKK